MKTGWEKVGMSAKEQIFYEVLSEMLARLEKIEHYLERMGSQSPS